MYNGRHSFIALAMTPLVDEIWRWAVFPDSLTFAMIGYELHNLTNQQWAPNWILPLRNLSSQQIIQSHGLREYRLPACGSFATIDHRWYPQQGNNSLMYNISRIDMLLLLFVTNKENHSGQPRPGPLAPVEDHQLTNARCQKTKSNKHSKHRESLLKHPIRSIKRQLIQIEMRNTGLFAAASKILGLLLHLPFRSPFFVAGLLDWLQFQWKFCVRRSADRERGKRRQRTRDDLDREVFWIDVCKCFLPTHSAFSGESCWQDIVSKYERDYTLYKTYVPFTWCQLVE